MTSPSGRSARRPHPLILIACFLVFVVAMAAAEAGVALTGLVLMIGVTSSLDGHWRAASSALRRLRWFFLSIGLLYVWGTPGTPLWPIGTDLAPWWMPTGDGLRAAVERMAAFAAIVLASRALLDVLSRHELLQAIQGLVAPFEHIGFPCQRLSIRILLVLEVLGEVQRLVAGCLATRDRSGSPFAQFGGVAASVFEAVVERADRAPLEPIRLPGYRPPPGWQWSYPMGLAIGAILLG